jgi:hypothetical protein
MPEDHGVDHSDVMRRALQQEQICRLERLKGDINPEYIQVQKTIVGGREQDTPKTRYRIRKIPITRAIRKRLVATHRLSSCQLRCIPFLCCGRHENEL